MDGFDDSFRFGSAAWASPLEIAKAGLHGAIGPLLGYSGEKAIRLDGDAPIITFGGAGSGKLRDLIAYTVCGCRSAEGRWTAPPRLFVNDSRGELAAIALQNQVRLGKAAYCINPVGLHGLPQHRVNPLDMLRRGSKTLYADTKLQAADLITLSGSPNGEYFELRGRQWTEMLMLFEVERNDGVSLPGFYDLVQAIRDPGKWPDIAEAMLNSAIAEVRSRAIEMHTNAKARDGIRRDQGRDPQVPGFLGDPMIRAALENADFSLDVLCRRTAPSSTSSRRNIRQTSADESPDRRRGDALQVSQPCRADSLFPIDEAATLGRFEALLRGYSYGRGMGCRMWSIWQDIGQVIRNYGRDAVSSFIGSSQTRRFLGVRDLETARLVSAMLGTQTFEYNPPVEQAAARRDMRLWAHQIMNGGCPFEIGFNVRTLHAAATTPIKLARPLLTPDGVLNMPENRQILFISGLNLPPI